MTLGGRVAVCSRSANPCKLPSAEQARSISNAGRTGGKNLHPPALQWLGSHFQRSTGRSLGLLDPQSAQQRVVEDRGEGDYVLTRAVRGRR
jgi:hypothetical protein